MIFYPHEDDLDRVALAQKLEILLEAAERYRGITLDASNLALEAQEAKKRSIPRDIKHAFNWQEIARALRETRELPENQAGAKALKAKSLNRLAEIFEVLRAARMPRLEAVRLALINEAKQLGF